MPQGYNTKQNKNVPHGTKTNFCFLVAEENKMSTKKLPTQTEIFKLLKVYYTPAMHEKFYFEWNNKKEFFDMLKHQPIESLYSLVMHCLKKQIFFPLEVPEDWDLQEMETILTGGEIIDMNETLIQFAKGKQGE